MIEFLYQGENMDKNSFYNTAYKHLNIGIAIIDKNSNKIEFLNDYALVILNIEKFAIASDGINTIFDKNNIFAYSVSEIVYNNKIKIVYAFENNIEKNGIVQKCPVIIIRSDENDDDDNDYHFKYFSSNISELIGYSADYLVKNNMKFRDIIHKNDIERFLIEKENALNNNYSELIFDPFRIITKDGKILWVLDKVMIKRNDKDRNIESYHNIIDVTKYIEIEMKLSLKENESKNIIKAANIGTWCWDSETGKINRNDKWYEMLGYRKNEFNDNTFETIKKICHPDDYIAAEEDFFKNFYSENEFYEQEFRLKSKNGDWVWILDKGKIIEYTKDRKPKKIFGVHIDITKQKEIEERFRLFIDSASEIFMILDENLNIVDINNAALNMIPDNISKDFIIGKSFPEYYPYVNKNGVEQYYEVIKTGKPINTVKKTINLRNEVRYIDISLFKMGKGVGYISRDVTDKFIHQEKIKKMSENLSKILLSSTFGVVIVDKNKKIKWVNNATLKMMGAENITEIKDKYCNDILCTKNDGYCPILDGGDSINNIECNLVTLKGDKIAILKTAKYIDYEGEEVILETFVDISERKKMERELKIESERLKFANKAKSEFLANMSHEIRTPLNGIIGFTDIMMKTKLLPIQYDFMRTIKESGEMLLDVITNILDFSKIEAGKMEFEINKVNLYDLIESAIDIVKFKAYEKKIILLFDLNIKNHEIVYTDSSKLKQVLINILGNAIKFTNFGYVMLNVEFDILKGTYLFSIKDTGIGIDIENQKKVLDSFSQADPTITRRYGGTGLGLSISNSILNLMGSELKIESEIGKGSNFNFEINIENEIIDMRKKYNENSVRTLIIENNSLIRRNIENKLRRIGVASNFAKNGISAFEMLKNYKYNYVIFDESISDEDFELIKEIENEKCKNIIINKHLNVEINSEKSDILKILIPIKTKELLEIYNDDIEQENLIDVFNNSVKENKYRILIAEDNIINMKLIKVILNNFNNNIEIFEASNGKEAVDQFKNNNIDLIFMDIQMPIMDGYNATKQIRKFDENIKIVALTASSLMSEKNYCLDIGMNDYMQKPITVNAMKKTLKKWL